MVYMYKNWFFNDMSGENERLPFLLAFILMCGMFSGCFWSKKADSVSMNTAPDMHTSRISLDWMGDYIGVLPCADCPGIFTHLKITENGKYKRRSYYLDRSKEYELRSGAFEWHSGGNKIRLDDGSQFQVREMELAMLASGGEHIGGRLSDQYLLAKSDVGPLLGNPPEAVLNRSWEVYRLIDEGVEFEKKYRPGFEVNENGKLSGQAQCNGFETVIDFSVTQGFQPEEMAITKRACAKMKQEAKFIRAFDQSKYYLVFSNQLLLLDNNYNLLLVANGEE